MMSCCLEDLTTLETLQLTGRTNNYRGFATKNNHDTSSKPTSFSLDYRDGFSRDLTSKDVFRQISHPFHGKIL